MRNPIFFFFCLMILGTGLGCGKAPESPVATPAVATPVEPAMPSSATIAEGTETVASSITEDATPEAATSVEEASAEEGDSDNPDVLQTVPVNVKQVTAAVADIHIDNLLQRIALRRGKPLFVNFWATWCTPCMEEMPRIVALNQKYGNKVDFLGVSCDSFTDSAYMVPDAMKQLNIDFATRILIVEDQNQAINRIDPQWSGALPATYIFNVKGEKVKSFFGEQSEETFENALKSVLPPTRKSNKK